MARSTQYDMTIIGGGSGGLSAARIAASLGANVLLVDKEELGGDCLHYGCVPNIEGLKESGYYTNNDLFDLEHLPASLIVIGGGPIGVEMGQAFARLGSKVTLITRARRILPKEDTDASTTLANVLTSEGIHLVTGATPVKVERNGNKKVVTVKQGEEQQTFEAEHILIALGRHPTIEGLALEAANVTYDAKGIKVDEHLQTSAPNIYAIGDVIGGYLFTHVAAYQAGVAVRNALVPISKKKVDYRVVPWCTFTEPEIARVGLTLEEAEKQHKDVRAEVFPFADVDRAQAENETTGFIKLVLAGKKAEIVGAHIVGLRAGELLGEMTLAIQHNMTIDDIYNTIHAYPTMATGIQQAAFEAYLKSDTAVSNRKVVRTLLTFR